MVTDFTPSDRNADCAHEPVSIRQAWLDDARSDHVQKPAGAQRSGDHPSTRESAQPQPEPTLGMAIQARRRELGMTQQDLAKRVNHLGGDMRQSDVSRLERGQVTLPRRSRVQQIAQALEMPPGALLARGGWSGAESSFVSESGEAHADAVPLQPETRHIVDVAQPVTAVEHPQARAGGAGSLAAHTEHILQRCQDEVEMVRRVLAGESKRGLYHS